jgi:hypothetical protein
MAGDWIKVEHATVNKPEVTMAAELLGISRREAVGLLFDYFCWLDSNLSDSCPGFVRNVSRRSLESILHCPGFAAVLESIGWATFDDEQRLFYVVNWDRHNGATAKSRALDQRRKKISREIVSGFCPVETGLEKRREEKSITKVLANIMSPSAPDAVVRAITPKATRLSSDWVLPSEWRTWALEAHNVPPKDATEISLAFRDFWIAKPGAGGCKLDWFATWRNWVRKETSRV